jgi:hypothetical protein
VKVGSGGDYVRICGWIRGEVARRAALYPHMWTYAV